MTTIAQLVAVVSANTSGFTAGMQTVQSGLQNVSSQTAATTSAVGSLGDVWSTVAARAAAACTATSAALASVQTKLNEIGDAAQRMGQELSLAVTLPAVGIIQTALAFDDLVTRATIGFTAITGSAQVAQQTIDDLQKMAVATPFDFSGLLQNAQSLLAMGFQAKELLPTIQAIGDAVAKSGGSQDNINHATLALSEMRAEASLSSVQMRELVMGAKIPAWDLLSAAMGKTTSELRKMTEQGLIPGKYAAQALLFEMEKTSQGAMVKLGGTLMAAASNLKDAATQALGSIFEPLYKNAASVANSVANVLMQIKGYITALPDSIKQKVADMLLALAAVGPAMLAVAGLAKALALLASPLGIAAVALAAGAYYLLQHKKAAQELGDWIEGHWPQIWGAATAALVVFTSVGILRTIVALRPLGTVAVTVAGVVTRAMLGMAASIAAALGVSVGAVLLAVAAIIAALAALYFAWKNNWLGFKDVVDFTFRAIAVQIDGFLETLALIPGAVGQMAQAVKNGFDVFGQATNNFDSAKVGEEVGRQFTGGFKGIVGGLPSWMTNLFKAPDISGLMKQIQSIKMPNMNIPTIGVPKYDPGPDKNAEKAAKKLQEIYSSRLESLEKETFLIGKNGKLAETEADILYGNLGKLNSREQGRLLTLAAQYDALVQQKKVSDLLQKAGDDVIVAKLSKVQQAVIAVAGGYRDWLKLSQEAQDQVGYDYYQQTQNEAMITGQGIAQNLRKELIGMGRDAAQALGEQAAGGTEAFERMMNIADGKGKSLADTITNLAAIKAFKSGAIDQIKSLQEQLYESGDAAKTASASVEHFFEKLQAETGGATKGWGVGILVTQAKLLGAQLDTAFNTKTISDWRDDLGRDIETAKQKIAGTYDPAKAAVADWQAQNQDAIDKIVAGGGSIAAVLADVSKKFTLEAQADAAEKFRDMVKDARNDFMQMTAKNPFAAWKQSLGPLPGVDDNQLKKLFDFQEKVQLAKDAASGIRDVIVGAFTDAFQNGAKTFFSSVVTGFNQMLQKMAMDYLSSQLMGLLTRTLGGMLGGSGGGLFGAAAGAIGGGGITSAAAAAAPGSSLFSGISQSVSFAGARAGGGPVLGGMPYLVGEKGPELFVPAMSGGTVIPNGGSTGGSAAGETHFHAHVTIQSSGGNREMDRRSGQQVAQAAMEEMQRTQRRNGKS